ncbi:MAG: ChbG/HpnK family deacetylase [Butyricimonas faecihominis]
MDVIVNADDVGMNHNVNLAIDYCFKKNIISSTTIMANMPGFDEAVKLACIGKYDKYVGMHFNLVEGVPLLFIQLNIVIGFVKMESSFINTTVFFFGVREKKQLERNLLLK